MSPACPCLSGETYAQCCGRYAGGLADPPTAEALMRSRYTAFVRNDVAYLLASWHSSTRPASLEMDPNLHWRRLDITTVSEGKFLDNQGMVGFRAHYREHGRAGVQAELSRFVRENGRWVYLDGGPLP